MAARVVTSTRIASTVTRIASAAASATAAPSSVAVAASATSLSPDGLGTHTSPTLWLAAVVCVAAGAQLLILGRRGWRLTTGMSTALMFALLTWVGIIDMPSTTTALSDGAVAGVVIGLAAVGAVAGATIAWQIGWALIGAEGPLAWGIGLLLLGDNLAIGSTGGRWALLMLIMLAGVGAVLRTKHVAVCYACGQSGAFLVALAIDLAVNADKGAAQGLRRLFDGIQSHQVRIGLLRRT